MLEYSWNYTDTTGIVWLYSKDEANNFDNIMNTYRQLAVHLSRQKELDADPKAIQQT